MKITLATIQHETLKYLRDNCCTAPLLNMHSDDDLNNLFRKYNP